jgi:cell division protein FtsW
MKAAVTTLLLCVAGLTTLGIVMLYSASMADPGGTRSLLMQLIWLFVGLIVCVSAASLDYRKWKKFTWPVFGVVALLLLLVLVPHIGHKSNGAWRWISLPGIRFQPSELGKVALILALAWYGDYHQRRMGTWKYGVAIPCGIIGLAVGLIFVEPDRGTAILLSCVAGGMLLIAGVRFKHLLPLGMAAGALLAISIMHDPMRRGRVMAWAHPEEHKQDVGLQGDHAMLALGSGGWTGVGLGESRQKLGFLPFPSTDFILPIIGEELGLVATLLVVLAFLLMMLCGFYIAWRAPDTFGMLLGAGLTMVIGLQAMFNISVVTSVLPNKGLPLPFISYGGSNLLMSLAAVGMLLAVARRARMPETSLGAALLEPGGIPSPQMT